MAIIITGTVFVTDKNKNDIFLHSNIYLLNSCKKDVR